MLLFGIAAPAAVAGSDNGVHQKLDEIKAMLVDLAARLAHHDQATQDALAPIHSEVMNIEDKLDVLHVEAIGNEGNADPGEDSASTFNNANILVRVSWKGEGVSGLTVSDFVLSTRLVPPGECMLEIDDLSTFGGPAGDYALQVTPVDHPFGDPTATEVCDWEAGDYDSSLVVSWNGMQGSTLVKIRVT